VDVDVFTELWKLTQQAGPFASAILLVALWAVNSERKAIQKKYDDIVVRFINLATDSTATAKDWQRILSKGHIE
jgi:hypothetical protein